MNGQQIIKLFYTSGITILRDVYECSPHDLAGGLMPLNTARKYTQLADVLFGPTDSPRLQRESVALAEERGLSLEYLEMVEKHAKKLKKRGAAWRLRAELIAFEGTFEEVEAYAKKRVMEEGGDTKKKPGVRLGRVVDGLRTISITDTQRRITDLEKTLDAAIT
ncbi:MAG: HNH endonuclease, partial [Corynebacterium sp.]|nr:HNH endonuclease [Corynebacterium sp.]